MIMHDPWPVVQFYVWREVRLSTCAVLTQASSSSFKMKPQDEAWLAKLSGAASAGCYVSGYVDGKEALDSFLEEYFAATHSMSCANRQQISPPTKTSSSLVSASPKD